MASLQRPRKICIHSLTRFKAAFESRAMVVDRDEAEQMPLLSMTPTPHNHADQADVRDTKSNAIAELEPLPIKNDGGTGMIFPSSGWGKMVHFFR